MEAGNKWFFLYCPHGKDGPYGNVSLHLWADSAVAFIIIIDMVDMLMCTAHPRHVPTDGRQTAEHGSDIYRTPVEQLSNIYRESIEHLSSICRTALEQLSSTDLTSIEHLSNIYRRPIECV